MNSVSDQQSLIRASTAGARTQSVARALKAASPTGADFAYLLRTSGIESGFNPNATSTASSAAGLFQFTEQTWLQMVKAHGAEYGLGSYASQIQTSASGTNYLCDPATRQAILDLRKDPQIAAGMTCELNKQNAEILRKNVGGSIGSTELYLAHFLGAGGASALLKARRATPDASAAAVVPAAAQANSSIFYGPSGQPRSVEQIYQHFAQKFDPTPASAATPASALSLADASTAALPSSSSLASSFANLLMEQMQLAQVASTIADDDEQSSFSVLA